MASKSVAFDLGKSNDDSSEDDSFEAIAIKNNGKYKKWLQDDYLKSLPPSCENGACYALSVIYIYLNYMHSLGDDTHVPDGVKITAIAGNGLIYSVQQAMTTAMCAQTSSSQGPSQKPPQKLYWPKFTQVLQTEQARNSVGVIQASEIKRKNVERTREDFENAITRIRDFNIAWLKKLTNDHLKPATMHVPQMDLDHLEDAELEALLDQLCLPGFHILDVPGHTQAVVVRKGKFKYFDPDEGQAIFTKKDDLEDFINQYLCTNYDGLVSVYSFQ